MRASGTGSTAPPRATRSRSASAGRSARRATRSVRHGRGWRPARSGPRRRAARGDARLRDERTRAAGAARRSRAPPENVRGELILLLVRVVDVLDEPPLTDPARAQDARRVVRHVRCAGAREARRAGRTSRCSCSTPIDAPLERGREDGGDDERRALLCRSVSVEALEGAAHRRAHRRSRCAGSPPSDDDVDELRRLDDDLPARDGRRGSARRGLGEAAASRSASLIDGTSRRARTLPWTWTTHVTVSSTRYASSATGEEARRRLGVAEALPQLFGDVRRDGRGHEHDRLGGDARDGGQAREVVVERDELGDRGVGAHRLHLARTSTDRAVQHAASRCRARRPSR